MRTAAVPRVAGAKQKKQNAPCAEVFLPQLLNRLAGMRSAIAAAMFGVFAAMSMYLSVGGLVRHLNSPDAAAAIAQSGSTAPAVRSLLRITPSGGDTRAGDLREKAAEPATGPRVCRLALLIDSDCLFD